MGKYDVYNELVLRAHEEDNDYLQGSVHGPVSKEITATELDVVGEIPKDLDGVYIRNGHDRRAAQGNGSGQGPVSRLA